MPLQTNKFLSLVITRTQVTFTPDMPIIDLQWNCEKFNMEEREEMMLEPRSVSRLCVLAICFKNGDIKLVTSYDDVSPVVINNTYTNSNSFYTRL